ncbi:MAG: hypothetical protein R3F49_01500 [Planctomycetota bacterium]
MPDLARLVRALADRELLGEALLTELLSPTDLDHGGDSGFGLGVDLVRLGDFAGVTVGGGGPGGALHIVRYPEADLTLVLAATAADAPLADLGRALARRVLGLAPPGVQDLPLDAEEALRFAGGYQLGCDRLVVGMGAAGRMTLSIIERDLRQLLYQGDGRFVAADDDECVYQFVFRDGDERASALVLMEHGQRTEAVRLE